MREQSYRKAGSSPRGHTVREQQNQPSVSSGLVMGPAHFCSSTAFALALASFRCYCFETVLPCSAGWLGAHCVEHAGLELRDLLAPAS